MEKPTDPFHLSSRRWRYFWSIVLLALGTGLAYLLELDISPTNLVMIYLLTAVIAALYLGRGPAILVSFLGVVAFDYFFVPPFYTLAVSDTEYIITFIGLLLVSIVISTLTVSAREQAEAARRREAETAALYALSRDLAAADGIEDVISALRIHIASDIARETVIYLPEGDYLRACSDPSGASPAIPEQDMARQVFTLGNPDSLSTGIFYLPLKTSQRIVGVLCVRSQSAGASLTPDQQLLLEAFASQTAQAIERVNLAEQTRQIKLLQATEKLQNALLNSISHDLRTPLVTITGALTTLEQQNNILDENARQSLVETAREESDRLNWLVGNLLDMTRLEAGALKVKREPCDVQDIIGTAIGQMEAQLIGRAVRVEVPDDFPLVPLDFVLIVHVLTNLIDNAIKYSPDNSPLEVTAHFLQDEVQLSVIDCGMGIPKDDLERVFDKFYRVQRPERVHGTGLGLAICKGIVEAHGGRIWASNRPGGGATITLALPTDNQ